MNPILFAAGVAFVALPIILHFLRRRRPPVLWGAMRFLQEAYRRRRRRMTLEQLLLLLCRCALVLAVALLIGRPLFSGAPDASGPREVFLIVDNSIASARLNAEGTALDELKRRGTELLDDLDASAGDRAALISLAGPAEGVVFPPSGDLPAVRRLLLGLQTRDSAADLSGALGIVGESAADLEPTGRSVVVLSELRRGSADLASALPPVPASIERVVVAEPADAPASNVAVTSVESVRPVLVGAGRVGGQAAITLERSGSPELGPSTVAVELWTARGGRLASGEIAFEAGQRDARGLVSFELPERADDPTRAALSGGGLVLEARLASRQADDTLDNDNVARRPIDRRRFLEVGLIARRSQDRASDGSALSRFGPADWVRLSLAPEAGLRDVRVADVRPTGVDGPRLASLDAAVVLNPESLDAPAWTALRGFAAQGGLVVVTPPSNEDTQLWTDSFVRAFDLGWSFDRVASESAGDTISERSLDADRGLLGILAGEFGTLANAVGVTRIAGVDLMTGDGTVELATESGLPFVVSGAPTPDENTGRGLVVYIASAMVPSWTDLPTRPLMVPLMQELIRQGVGRAKGEGTLVAGGASPTGGSRLVGAQGSPAAAVIRDAGVYTLEGAPDTAVAVNPDTRGARLDANDRAQLAGWFESSLGEDRLAWLDGSGAIERAGGAAEPIDTGTLALWLASIALAIAVVETLLARAASRGAGIDGHAAPAAGRVSA
ncbi:MAG: BatA domain-containing protein [Planctomycetota bacterium]